MVGSIPRRGGRGPDPFPRALVTGRRLRWRPGRVFGAVDRRGGPVRTEGDLVEPRGDHGLQRRSGHTGRDDSPRRPASRVHWSVARLGGEKLFAEVARAGRETP